MDTSDSYSCVTRFSGGKRHREVVLARLRSAGSRIEDCARRKFIEKLVIIDDVHPLRKLRSKRVTLRPNRLGGKRIVIARHQEDWRMSAALIAKTSQPVPPRNPGAGVGSSNRSPAHSTASTALRRATSRMVAITSIRARDSFFCASSGKDGNRRPRCQSAVCRIFSTTPSDSSARSGTPPGTAGLRLVRGTEARDTRFAIFDRPRPTWNPKRRSGVPADRPLSPDD